MNAYLITTLGNPAAYPHDIFSRLAYEVRNLGYDINYSNIIDHPKLPELMEVYTLRQINELCDGILSASFVGIDYRLKDIYPRLYALSLGILASKRSERGNYIIFPSTTDQDMLNNIDKHPILLFTYDKIIVDGSGKLKYTDRNNNGKPIIVESNLLNILNHGFKKLEIENDADITNTDINILLGYAAAVHSLIIYKGNIDDPIINIITDFEHPVDYVPIPD